MKTCSPTECAACHRKIESDKNKIRVSGIGRDHKMKDVSELELKLRTGSLSACSDPQNGGFSNREGCLVDEILN